MVVVQRPQSHVQKSVMHVQSCCVFLLAVAATVVVA